MNAVTNDSPPQATREDLSRLFAPQIEEFKLSSGKVLWLRCLTVEERARILGMGADAGLDALTVMLACGVIDAGGNPIFGAYKDALPLIRGLGLQPEMIEMAKVISRLSGMEADQQEAASGN